MTSNVPTKTLPQLYQAAISCKHEIDRDQIILHRDHTKEGNALSQLADRLDAAAGALATSNCLPAVASATGLYSIEKHGAGWAIYQGRDGSHHGLNIGYLTEASDDVVAMLEQALNIVRPRTQELEPPHAGELLGWFSAQNNDAIGVRMKSALMAIQPWNASTYTMPLSARYTSVTVNPAKADE